MPSAEGLIFLNKNFGFRLMSYTAPMTKFQPESLENNKDLMQQLRAQIALFFIFVNF